MIKPIIAIVLMCGLAFGGQVDSKEILQQCRAALVDLQRAREVEVTLRAKVTELEAADRVSQERMKALESAVMKYESAIAARTQAEALVSEIRLNYERQVALCEKQLAVEQGRTSHWKTLAKLGVFAGLMLGGVLGYAVANK